MSKRKKSNEDEDLRNQIVHPRKKIRTEFKVYPTNFSDYSEFLEDHYGQVIFYNENVIDWPRPQRTTIHTFADLPWELFILYIVPHVKDCYMDVKSYVDSPYVRASGRYGRWFLNAEKMTSGTVFFPIQFDALSLALTCKEFHRILLHQGFCVVSPSRSVYFYWTEGIVQDLRSHVKARIAKQKSIEWFKQVASDARIDCTKQCN